MAVNLSPVAGAAQQFFTNSGIPLAGGLLYTYAAGTTTPTATYTDNTGSVANANPIVLDAYGRLPAELWLTVGTNYKFVLQDATAVTIGTWDNITSSPGTAVGLVGGAAGQVPWQSAANTTGFVSAGTSGQVFTSGGTGTPTWTSQSALSVGTATNLAGGAAGRVPYQTGSGATGFVAVGTANQVLLSNATSAPTWANQSALTAGTVVDGAITPIKLSQPLTLGTSQATTSGTSIDFTGLPSWIKRITVLFVGVSTNGANNIQVQLGTGGTFVTTGYDSGAANDSSSTPYTTGFGLTDGYAAVSLIYGALTLMNAGSNNWVGFGNINKNGGSVNFFAGWLALGGTLDRVRLTTVGSTDTFDGGSVNILYE